MIYFTQQYDDFNPRPPWGGRQAHSVEVPVSASISIHALRGEGDALNPRLIACANNFNPRPPWGGRQRYNAPYPINVHISIHALRGEGDTETEQTTM